ncbi:hypothetical protein [Lentibacillus sp. CBA3610]|uniref:hypothetical protein n=1 Tax=Lentibacillus sp. CBA3610 TaxID=2518176 RepID=UPI0015956143|nr:hypothetical protein [Lentibacillus sp. CBA3610]QKY71498.1 hypothetical protein Len3610_19865 [Lentibacillus sp. CBA3610]
MEDNVVSFKNNAKRFNCSDEELIKKLQDLISRFQDPNLSKKDREAVFQRINQLTDQLTGENDGYHKCDL